MYIYSYSTIIRKGFVAIVGFKIPKHMRIQNHYFIQLTTLITNNESALFQHIYAYKGLFLDVLGYNIAKWGSDNLIILLENGFVKLTRERNTYYAHSSFTIVLISIIAKRV